MKISNMFNWSLKRTIKEWTGQKQHSFNEIIAGDFSALESTHKFKKPYESQEES